MEVISEVQQIIQTMDPNHVLFCGDMNTDLARTSPHSIALKQFIQDFDMQACIDLEFADVPYTFIGPRSTSRIDHIIASPAIASCVESCGIIIGVWERFGWGGGGGGVDCPKFYTDNRRGYRIS